MRPFIIGDLISIGLLLLVGGISLASCDCRSSSTAGVSQEYLGHSIYKYVDSDAVCYTIYSNISCVMKPGKVNN